MRQVTLALVSVATGLVLATATNASGARQAMRLAPSSLSVSGDVATTTQASAGDSD